jgi:diaminohydroxyphosphoribosylaminopyrimidine deaminase / 5-amino-6-(5-phosphoribosylamino)uracil reductase
MFTELDHQFMNRALMLAERGLYSTSPNPRVGCVIVRDSQIIGEGWHEKVGEPHAEVLAIRDAIAKGYSVKGATAYVTLEPCSHFGRTPPCADALVREGLGLVVAAMEDPNPLVNGQGFDKLRAAGIGVRRGLLEKQARDLNPGFISRVLRNRPYLRMKAGMSLDARVALNDGSSQWITSEMARNDGHAWRAQACAILTGIGTVRDDDPQLNVRAIQTNRQPLKVLLDSAFEVDPNAKIFATGLVIVVVAVDLKLHAQKVALLQAKGAEVVSQFAESLDGTGSSRRKPVFKDGRPKTNLIAVLSMLNERGLSEVHVEAGSKLNGSLLREGLVDELLLYVAPSLIGAGQPFADLAQVSSLDQKHEFEYIDVTKIGEDLRLRARRKDSFMKVV